MKLHFAYFLLSLTTLLSTTIPLKGQKKTYASKAMAAVWTSGQGRLQGTDRICFSSELIIERPQYILLNSQEDGPIGVKDVIDALRIVPDPKCNIPNNRLKILFKYRLQPDDMIQVIWRPEISRVELLLAPSENQTDQCGRQPPLPNQEVAAAFSESMPLNPCDKLVLRIFSSGKSKPTLVLGIASGCDL